MKTRGSYILIIVLTVLLVFGYAHAKRSDRPKRNLRFLTSDKPMKWETNELGRPTTSGYGGRGGGRGGGFGGQGRGETLAVKESYNVPQGVGVIEPNYVAVFMIRNNRKLNDRDNSIYYYDEEFEKLTKHYMSKQQNIFLNQHASSLMSYASNGIYLAYKLYAVTEEDARKMAETNLEWLDDKAYAAMHIIQNENENLKSELGKAKERISQIHRSLEYYNKIKKTTRVNFRINDKSGITVNYDNLPPADIQNRVLEYHNMLNMLEIDIAGHEAKIRTLRDYMGKGGGETQLRTHQMLIQEEVELAGAMARRQAIFSPVKVMNSYLDAIQNIQKIEKERKALTVKIEKLQADLQKSEETLSDPPGHMRPVEVFMNRITIHPVKKGEDKSD